MQLGFLLNREVEEEEQVVFLPKSHLSCVHLCQWGRILNLPLTSPHFPLLCSEDLEAMGQGSCPACLPSSSLHRPLRLLLPLTPSLRLLCLKVTEIFLSVAKLNMCFFIGLPSSQPSAPWQQHQTPPTTSNTTPTEPRNMLELIRQELQTELDTYGITDPLEVEFGTTVRRLMDSCTKDSIAVSTSEIKGCHVRTVSVSLSVWEELDSLSFSLTG